MLRIELKDATNALIKTFVYSWQTLTQENATNALILKTKSSVKNIRAYVAIYLWLKPFIVGICGDSFQGKIS